MKTGVLILIVALAISGCLATNHQLIKSKISRTEQSEKNSSNAPVRTALQSLAQKTALELSIEEGIDWKVLVEPFSCVYYDKNKSLDFYLDSLFREYLVRYSRVSNFYLLEKLKDDTADIAGSPIIRADFRVRSKCIRLEDKLKISLSVIKIRSNKTAGIFSEWLSLKDLKQDGDFLVYQNRIYDFITALHWQRTDNRENYSYAAAKSYCEGLIIDGMDNWRMPESRELYSIIARPVENKQKLFGYSYGRFWQEQGCHWFLKSQPSVAEQEAVNLDSGKYVVPDKWRRMLGFSEQQQCRIKCVRAESD